VGPLPVISYKYQGYNSTYRVKKTVAHLAIYGGAISPFIIGALPMTYLYKDLYVWYIHLYLTTKIN